MLALLYNAALEECISAWRRSGAGISLYDRFRSLTAVPWQDPDWRRMRGLVDRSAPVPLNRAIAEQNWREIPDALKCRAASVRVSFVESTPVGMSPDCSHCGTRASEALSGRFHRYGVYGLEPDRNESVARNVLSRGLCIVAGTATAGGKAQCATAASGAR